MPSFYPRPVRELLGQRKLSTTMIYAHLRNKPGLGMRGPVEGQEPLQTPAFPAMLYENFPPISR
jgi:hypothetical protein